MKSLIFKILVLLSITVNYSCKAQRATNLEYINFYNNVTPKINLLVPNKTQFYGQSFSNFYTELLSKNLTVIQIGLRGEYDISIQKNTLVLEFTGDKLASYGISRGLQYPQIYITFQNVFPNQVETMMRQYEREWNSNFEQFFSNLIIQKIEFGGINGYNSSDRTLR